MNVLIITKQNVKDGALDALADALPAIIARVLEVPGGHVAIVKPEQISLEFCQASVRDVGADIRLMVFARSNAQRTATEHVLAREILDRVTGLVASAGENNSVDVRLYLMEIGAAYKATSQ